MTEPLDFNGQPLTVPEDADRFIRARGGDHTMTPFQCPLCCCRNIKGRNLNPKSTQDDFFECQVIRSTLDAFWSRAPGTLKNHLTEIRFLIRYGRAMGYDIIPPLGPWPLREDLGMRSALPCVCRALEKGTRGRKFVTHETSRKIRTALTNLWASSPLSGEDLTFSTNRGRYHATRAPSESRWFELFSKGFRIRTGVTVRQDYAYTLDVVHEFLCISEEEYSRARSIVPLEWISAVMFFLVTCLGGMRGYEAVWTDLAALVHDIKRCEEIEDFEGVGWPIVGRFKAEGGGNNGHVIPIAGTTNSGIQFFLWAQRFVAFHILSGTHEGWAFHRPDGSRAKASDYSEHILSRLVKIQEARPDLIDPAIDVWDAYGMQRSGRRFFDTTCRLMNVSDSDIKAQCRWISERTARGAPIARDMVDLYTEYKHMKKALLRPSKAL